MKLKCITCGKVISKSYDVDPIYGDILVSPLGVDEKGLKHAALVCLHCGTIHDVSGSFLQRIFSGFQSPWKMHKTIHPWELGLMIMERTKYPEKDARKIAIEDFGIPEQVIDVLVERNILAHAFAQPSTDDLITQIVGNAKSDFEEVTMSNDLMLEKCVEIANSHNIHFEAREWGFIVNRRDAIASSKMSGACVHRDVFQSICLVLVVYDGLFRAGIKALNDNQLTDSMNSLEKAQSILKWPTALYGLGITYEKLGNSLKSGDYFHEAKAIFEERLDLLSNLIPQVFTKKSDLLIILADILDEDQSRLLGLKKIQHINLRYVKDEIQPKSRDFS